MSQCDSIIKSKDHQVGKLLLTSGSQVDVMPSNNLLRA